LQADLTSKWQNSCYSAFIDMAEDTELSVEAKDRLMKKKIERMVNDLNKELDKITKEYAYDNLKLKDSESHAWTNEDPSFQDTFQYIKNVP